MKDLNTNLFKLIYPFINIYNTVTISQGENENKYYYTIDNGYEQFILKQIKEGEKIVIKDCFKARGKDSENKKINKIYFEIIVDHEKLKPIEVKSLFNFPYLGIYSFVGYSETSKLYTFVYENTL